MALVDAVCNPSRLNVMRLALTVVAMPDSEEDARQREYIKLMQADIERMREATQESNRETMHALERSMCEKFRQLREDRGWSQTELSEQLAEYGIDMHQTTIAKMESGKRPLRVAEMFGLSHVFKMPPGAVFFMPMAVSDFPGMEALSQELARTEEMIAEFRRLTMKSVDTFVDFAADYGVKRDHLVRLMRDASSGPQAG